jgi:hypothetical protein
MTSMTTKTVSFPSGSAGLKSFRSEFWSWPDELPKGEVEKKAEVSFGENAPSAILGKGGKADSGFVLGAAEFMPTA